MAAEVGQHLGVCRQRISDLIGRGQLRVQRLGLWWRLVEQARMAADVG